MSLGKEIERKWLVNRAKIPFDLCAFEPFEMEQSYISFSPTVRLRNTNNTSYVLCVKSPSAPGSMARDEFELPLTRQQYENLLTKIEGSIIRKTRYCVPASDGHTMEFDVFAGEFEGLVYMEIEFPSEEEAMAYPNPEWAIKDVTHDHRYKNACLAKLGLPEELK